MMITSYRHVINRFQYLTILHSTRKLSGISPVSPYTIFVYVDLFKDKIYLQNFKCNRPITVQSSIPHASVRYITAGVTIVGWLRLKCVPLPDTSTKFGGEQHIDLVMTYLIVPQKMSDRKTQF